MGFNSGFKGLKKSDFPERLVCCYYC